MEILVQHNFPKSVIYIKMCKDVSIIVVSRKALQPLARNSGEHNVEPNHYTMAQSLVNPGAGVLTLKKDLKTRQQIVGTELRKLQAARQKVDKAGCKWDLISTVGPIYGDILTQENKVKTILNLTGPKK